MSTLCHSCRLMDQALKIYGEQEHFIPEKARVNYRRGKLLQLLRRDLEAQEDFHQEFHLF